MKLNVPRAKKRLPVVRLKRLGAMGELPLPLGEGWGEGLVGKPAYATHPHPQPFPQREKGAPTNAYPQVNNLRYNSA